MMDDSLNVRTSLNRFKVSLKLFEKFGRTYGAKTDFSSGKTEIMRLGADPGDAWPALIELETSYGTFAYLCLASSRNSCVHPSTSPRCATGSCR